MVLSWSPLHNEGWHHSATFAVKTATSHFRGNHLAAVGRLVKVPAFVEMRYAYVGSSATITSWPAGVLGWSPRRQTARRGTTHAPAHAAGVGSASLRRSMASLCARLGRHACAARSRRGRQAGKSARTESHPAAAVLGPNRPHGAVDLLAGAVPAFLAAAGARGAGGCRCPFTG